MEVSHGDDPPCTVVAVQGGLAMRSIAYLGSQKQKNLWLRPLARGGEFGAIVLT